MYGWVYLPPQRRRLGTRYTKSVNFGFTGEGEVRVFHRGSDGDGGGEDTLPIVAVIGLGWDGMGSGR